MRGCIEYSNADAALSAPGAEARQAMIAVAAGRRLMAYSDFVAERRSLGPGATKPSHRPHTRRDTMGEHEYSVRYEKTTSNS